MAQAHPTPAIAVVVPVAAAPPAVLVVPAAGAKRARADDTAAPESRQSRHKLAEKKHREVRSRARPYLPFCVGLAVSVVWAPAHAVVPVRMCVCAGDAWRACACAGVVVGWMCARALGARGAGITAAAAAARFAEAQYAHRGAAQGGASMPRAPTDGQVHSRVTLDWCARARACAGGRRSNGGCFFGGVPARNCLAACGAFGCASACTCAIACIFACLLEGDNCGAHSAWWCVCAHVRARAGGLHVGARSRHVHAEYIKNLELRAALLDTQRATAAGDKSRCVCVRASCAARRGVTLPAAHTGRRRRRRPPVAARRRRRRPLWQRCRRLRWRRQRLTQLRCRARRRRWPRRRGRRWRRGWSRAAKREVCVRARTRARARVCVCVFVCVWESPEGCRGLRHRRVRLVLCLRRTLEHFVGTRAGGDTPRPRKQGARAHSRRRTKRHP